MLNVMVVQATAADFGGTQAGVDRGIGQGWYLGYAQGITNLEAALNGPSESQGCAHYRVADSVFSDFWANGGGVPFAPGYNRWVARSSRAQPAPTDVTIAGTTFFSQRPVPRRRPSPPRPPAPPTRRQPTPPR